MSPSHDENADAFAQEVVQTYGFNMQAGIPITHELRDAYVKADSYQRAKQRTDFYRRRNALLTEKGEVAVQAEETARRTLINPASLVPKTEQIPLPTREQLEEGLDMAMDNLFRESRDRSRFGEP
jgi:hypothetical protein